MKGRGRPRKNISTTPVSKRTIDYLDEDPVISAQQYMAISFCELGELQSKELLTKISETLRVSVDTVKKVVDLYKKETYSKRALKVRGVFSDVESTRTKCDFFTKIDPDVSTFVSSVGKWVTFNPEQDLIEDQVYAEEQLQDLMKGYKENAIKAKELYEKRKREMTMKAIKEGSAEGQAEAALKEEPLVAVENRYKITKETIKDLQERLKEAEETLKVTESKLNESSFETMQGTHPSEQEIVVNYHKQNDFK